MPSFFGRLLARRSNLLEQSVEVFPLEEAGVVHRIANGCDFASVDLIAERIRRNAKILSGLENSEVFRLFSTLALPDSAIQVQKQN